jgi:hypothetical protein
MLTGLHSICLGCFEEQLALQMKAYRVKFLNAKVRTFLAELTTSGVEMSVIKNFAFKCSGFLFQPFVFDEIIF